MINSLLNLLYKTILREKKKKIEPKKLKPIHLEAYTLCGCASNLTEKKIESLSP